MWRVLIADDEPKIRQGLKETLEQFDLPLIVCAEARNGMEALEKAKKFEPDILLVDICMPKLSGIRFLEEIRKLGLECRMIVISGFNEFTYAKQAIRLGLCRICTTWPRVKLPLGWNAVVLTPAIIPCSTT